MSPKSLSDHPQGEFFAPLCHSRFLCQSFVPSDRGRDLLQDEDQSGNRPHSFPGYYALCSGWAPERFRSVPVIAGSSEGHRVALEHQECGSLFN